MLATETVTLFDMSDERTRQFEQTILEYRQSLARIAATYEIQPELQQELHQEILLAIWKALPGFREESGLHTFIYRVAHNQAMNHVAKHSRLPNHEPLEKVELSSESCPELQAIQSQQTQALFKAMYQLPILQRQILTLALEGLSYDEIATVTGLSNSNVGVRLNRAKKALKDKMEQTHE